MNKRLAQIINAYDLHTEYIDSYWQEMEAREKNEKLTAEFNTLARKVILGYDGGVPAYLKPATEEKVAEWLRAFEIPAAWLPEGWTAPAK